MIKYYFSVPKGVKLNSTHYLIMRIHKKRELKNIAINHSADIGYEDHIGYEDFFSVIITENVQVNHILF